MSKSLTYLNYLKVEELLQLQHPASTPEEHDEMLFIIIHQVYELWFKQMLHEMDYLCTALRDNQGTVVAHTLHRILRILKTVVAQIDVLETMTPLDFNSFRAFLESASGFQSVQFRELEFVMGHKREAMLKHVPAENALAARLHARYHAPTLWDAFLVFLVQNGYEVPDDLLARDVTHPIAPSPTLQNTLIHIYRTNPTVMNICERLVDFDEGVQEWRYRHVKMVERTIGSKPGTGGSPGVKYLQATVHPLFPDLWAIRSEF